jgi:hypothetical protein
MKIDNAFRLLALCVAVTAAACSGKGPDVTDPNVRSQVSLIATSGTNGDRLMQYSEASGVVTEDAYASANHDSALGLPIDAIYPANARLYLHHRATGTITVLDADTRKKSGTITGFPASADSGLCGMAFSNLSDAWVISYDSRLLYLVDGVNNVIAQAIPLPGNPTAVGATGTKVFVGMILPDGRSQVAVLSSNGDFSIERTIDFPSPVIYASANTDRSEMLFITAGSESSAPTLHYVNATEFNTIFEVPFNSPALTSYIGKEPMFAAISENFYLYVATPVSLVRVDTQGRSEMLDWLVGNYRVVGVDRWNDLVYAAMEGVSNVQRVEADGSQLDDITLPSPVKAIAFLSSNRVQ